MKKLLKKLTVFAVAAMIVLPVFGVAMQASAGDPDNLMWGDLRTDVQGATGLGDTDPRIMASNVVRIMLGFLGIIAVLLILFGGFKWMTAAGNEDKVGEAKRMIGAGVIGLIIIMAAFGIANFVINAVYDATNPIG